MAIVRGVALKLGAGSGRCQVWELCWDEHNGLDTGRVLSGCDHPPVMVVLGSGVCESHAPLYLVDRGEGGWGNN